MPRRNYIDKGRYKRKRMDEEAKRRKKLLKIWRDIRKKKSRNWDFG